MKKTDLVEIIRTVVREELDKSLSQYLMEVLAEKITSSKDTITESRQRQTTPAPAVQQRTKPKINVGFEAPIKQPPAVAPRVFSSNPALNAVLNETVGGIPDESEFDTPSAIDTIRNLPPEVLTENKDVAGVAHALTRNYSSLLKAVEAKARNSRP